MTVKTEITRLFLPPTPSGKNRQTTKHKSPDDTRRVSEFVVCFHGTKRGFYFTRQSHGSGFFSSFSVRFVEQREAETRGDGAAGSSSGFTAQLHAGHVRWVSCGDPACDLKLVSSGCFCWTVGEKRRLTVRHPTGSDPETPLMCARLQHDSQPQITSFNVSILLANTFQVPSVSSPLKAVEIFPSETKSHVITKGFVLHRSIQQRRQYLKPTKTCEVSKQSEPSRSVARPTQEMHCPATRPRV